MAATGKLRGHDIEYDSDGEQWVYADTREPTVGAAERPCGHCGIATTDDGHDGCIGELPGPVRNACCGHGQTREAYIQYQDGARIAGSHAIAVMEYVRRQREEKR